MKAISTYWLQVMIIFIPVFVSSGQSIRKDYREFTNQEMVDYRNALQWLKANGQFDNLAMHHSMHFSSIIHTTSGYTGELFLPWHRFFMLDFEWMMRNTGSTATYLSLPYWDWRTDNTTSANWRNDFISSANLPGFTFTRSVGASGFLGTTANITSCLGLVPFWANSTTKNANVADFSHRLEYYHDFVHVWVGGTMNSGASPADPIFYLHHNMIDKIWQDWEDQNTGLQSSFPNGATANFPFYRTSEAYPFNVYANNLKDARYTTTPASSVVTSRTSDVWFAFNKKVLIDGSNGSPFVCNDITTPYVYRYTAATTTGGNSITGAIYVGDIQRDANDNVVADTKGGVKVVNGARVSFLAGGSVTFLPGFNSELGAVFTAKTITIPNGARETNEFAFDNFSELDANLAINVYPNPISVGNLNFSKTAENFKLVNTSGIEVLKGSNADQINVDGLTKGLYLLHIDGKSTKVVIE